METKPRKQYTAEFKSQAVALMATGKPVAPLAEELCVSSNLLDNWRLHSPEAQGGRSGRPAPPAARGRPAQRGEPHFKKSRGDFRRKDPAELRAMILRISTSTGSSTRRICAVIEAPRSTFYHAATPTESQLCDQKMGGHIERIFRAHRRRDGCRRILAQLADEDHTCAPDEGL